MKKTEGRKSRDTVPLTIKTVEPLNFLTHMTDFEE
jgi:hypothetical protein